MTRDEIGELAKKHLSAGDPAGWFEPLYAKAAGDPSVLPWADLKPNSNLLSWLDCNPAAAASGRAVVVGCGLGDDAEELSGRGASVTGFDISPSAIDWCRKRFPQSKVTYRTADLLSPPRDFDRAFDFVFESYTLQALPPDVRTKAVASVASFVAPGGQLLIICRGRDASDPLKGPPWPLTRQDLAPLTSEHRLVEKSFEDYLDPEEDPPARRFRCVYER